MNDEYTPEDFANARFAEHTDGRIAMRAEPETGIPWYVGDDQIKRLDAVMARDGWRPVREHAPLTLDTLREAWESAIGFTTVHVGDTIIQRDTGGESFSVYVADRGYPRPPLDIRVLRRAPKPEPWQALADVMIEADLSAALSIPELAEALHQSGVRVTGGDEA